MRDGCDDVLYIVTAIYFIVTIVTIVTDGCERMEKMKKVQIPEELFLALIRYHLADMEDDLPLIKKELERKLDAMVKHQIYTRYKVAPTETEREKARQEYLDAVGMHRNFRW